MGPCYTPSLSTPEQIKRQLLECRTFAFDKVMVAAHEYICQLEKEVAKLCKKEKGE